MSSTKENRLMLSRRALLSNGAAGVAAGLVSTTIIAKNANAALTQAFPDGYVSKDYIGHIKGIPTFKAANDGVQFFNLKTIPAKDLIKLPNKDYPYGQMSFRVDRHTLLPSHIAELPDSLPKILGETECESMPVEIDAANRKTATFQLERARNRIAKNSRRGRGTVVFYPVNGIIPFQMVSNLQWVPVVGLKEYVMMFVGSWGHDSPIVGINAWSVKKSTMAQREHYWTSPDLANYMVKLNYV
jgi:hypothetical protein